jgi:hypothetical protein
MCLDRCLIGLAVTPKPIQMTGMLFLWPDQVVHR